MSLPVKYNGVSAAVVSNNEAVTVLPSVGQFLSVLKVPGLSQLEAGYEAVVAIKDITNSLIGSIKSAVDFQSDSAEVLSKIGSDAEAMLGGISKLQDVIKMYESASGIAVAETDRKQAIGEAMAIILAMVDCIMGAESRIMLEDAIESGLAPSIKEASERMQLDVPKMLSFMYARLHNSTRLSGFRHIIQIMDMTGYVVTTKQTRAVQDLESGWHSFANFFADPLDTFNDKAYVFDFRAAVSAEGSPTSMMTETKFTGADASDDAIAGVKDWIAKFMNEFVPNSHLIHDIDFKKTGAIRRDLVCDLRPVSDPYTFRTMISYPFINVNPDKE